MNSTDFVSDLPMDVPLAFYPPPTVCVPQIEIPPLREYEYKFENEKAAIFRWKSEKRVERNNEKTERMEKQRQRHMEEEGTVRDGETEARHFSAEEKEEQGKSRTEAERESLNGHEQQPTDCLKVQSNHPSKTAHPLHFSSSSLLRPVPMSASSASTSSIGSSPNQSANALQKSYSTNNNTLDGLEEFEPRRDLFDLMELRSLDARKELEKFFDL